MAKLRNELHNDLSGRLGNLVYYKSYGQTCVRSLPSTYRDRKSDKQIINRERIKGIGSLFQIFRPALRYDIANKHSSSAAVFCSLNWKNVSFDIETYKLSVKYDELVLSNASMKDLLGLTISRSANHVEFQWELDSLQDDSYYVLCVAFAKGIQQVQIADVKRKKLSATVNLPQGAGEIITYTIAHRRTAS
jgi:hypothetical protein